MYRFSGIRTTGRRISCKKRESRTAFELRRQLNSHVGRRCAPDDRRMFRRPLNGRAASVQHPLNLHLCLCRSEAAAKLARKLHKKGSCASSDRSSNFRDKTNVRLKRVLCALIIYNFQSICIYANKTNSVRFIPFPK